MNKTPTLKEIKAAGYYVNIRHLRAYDVAYKVNDRLYKEVMYLEKDRANQSELMGFGLHALLPKGGRTEVEVYDPETKARFWADSSCHPEDHYVCSEGIKECLKKVTGMMLVSDGVEGFDCRF